MSRMRRFDWAALAVAAWVASAPATILAADPLARPEFDQEISLKMREAGVANMFHALSGITRVPFFIDFEPDPRLKMSFSSDGTPARAVLVALASAHGLEYFERGDGVAVARKGVTRIESVVPVGPSSAKVWQVNVPVGSDGKLRLGEGIAVRAVPPAGGRQVAVELQVRGADGRVMSTPRVTTQMGQPMEIKQGAERGNRRPSIMLKLTPIKESAEGLECEMEAIVSRSVSPTRWTEDHREETVTAGKSETVLVTTDDGIQVVLTRWQRTTP